ncbi:MAG: hypothetical protein COB02_13610 [Candidatus Cloacimonadota bacterium]|nr:MAG: hypothetical protein COB02_13610 [Candidatus Cloacimonadota bacterium]
MKSLTFILVFLMVISISFTIGRRPYRAPGLYTAEPYPVEYRYPGEYWGFEKRFDNGAIKLHMRELNEAEEYRNYSAPFDQRVKVHFEDRFGLGQYVHSYQTMIPDESGKMHRITFHWSSYYQVKSRSFGLFKKRKFVQYIKVTIDGKRLFTVDDYVDNGAYDYEDFFSLGKQKYRVKMMMQSHKKDYYFGVTLTAGP